MTEEIKAAFITGASDRIGRSIAIKLASMGFDLALHYNKSETKIKSLQHTILKYDVKCRIYQCDFSKIENIDPLIEKIRKDFKINLLINNACLFAKSDPATLPSNTEFAEIFNINFYSPYLLSKLIDSQYRDCLIINMLDTKITKNEIVYFDYLLTKKMLKALTELLAVKLAPSIRVNGISPGLILPPIDKDFNYILKLSESIPLKRVGDLIFIDNSIEFLINNKFITGQILYIDGGQHL